MLGLNSIYRDQRLCAHDVGSRGVFFSSCAAAHSRPLPGGTIPPHDGHGPVHVAFSIAADELPVWEERLKAEDIAIEGSSKWRAARHLLPRSGSGPDIRVRFLPSEQKLT